MENRPAKNRWEWLYRLVALDSARHWFVGGGAVLSAIVTAVTGFLDHQTPSGIIALTLVSAASFLVFARMVLWFLDRFLNPPAPQLAPTTAERSLVSTANPDGTPSERYLIAEHQRLQAEAARLATEVREWKEFSEALELEHEKLERLTKAGEESHERWVSLYDQATEFRKEIQALWERASETVVRVDAILGGFDNSWAGGLSMKDLLAREETTPEEKIALAQQVIAEYNRGRAAEISPSAGTGLLADTIRALAGKSPLITVTGSGGH